MEPTSKDQVQSTSAEGPACCDHELFEGPTWKGPPDAYSPEKIFHAPTEEQQARGWKQNWDKYKTCEDKTFEQPGGRKLTVRYFDLSGGDKVTEYNRACKEQKAKQEREEWQLFRQNLKDKLRESQRKFKEPLPQENVRACPQGTVHTSNGGHIPIPLVGLGTWKGRPGQTKAAVQDAIRAGYRHIDCAAYYGNETEIGEALDNLFRNTQLRRSDIFVTGKLWNAWHGKGNVEAACRRSLRDLKLRHFDLYLIHWPVTGNRGPDVVPAIDETWREMEKLVDQGLVKAIGMSNFSVKKMQSVLEYARVRPSVVQAEAHPYFRNDQLVSWCKNNNIHFTAYSPLGSPDSAGILQRTANAPVLLRDPAVLEIAARCGHDAGQVLIRWALQYRPGCSVLPKSVTPARIKSNLEGVLDWKLTMDDMQQLSNLCVNQRMVDGSYWVNPQGPYRTLKDLWDEGDDDQSMAQLSDVQHNAGSYSPETAISTAQGNLFIPLIGLGTWKGKPGQTCTAVESALLAGYRHIDCAQYYGNEREVGEAFVKVFESSQVRRDQVFVTGKLWNADHGRGKVETACRKTLKDLNISYLDLYLIHWPVTGNIGPEVKPTIKETWREMEALVDKGLVKAIGMSNFSVRKMEEVLGYAHIRPSVLQAESHPYFRNDELVAWCTENKVHFTAYSPLGSPDSASLLERKGEHPNLMDDPAVLEISKRTGHDVGQVLLRWALQHKPNSSVLPKSVTPARIKGNLEGVLSWELNKDDMNTLSTLPVNQRMVDGSFWLNPKGPYRTLQDLWDA